MGHGHFNPTPDVKYVGLSKEQEDILRKLPISHPGKRTGAWLVDSSHWIMVIYEEAGEIKFTPFFSNGERFDSVVGELPSQHGRRFRPDGSDDTYVVNLTGRLEIYNAFNEMTDAAGPL